jgi:SAM-dependent methyltransferase
MTQRPSKQVWSAQSYETNARFVSDLGSEILSWLAPKPGERILDLGCGDGALTEKLGLGGAAIVGFDASPSLLAAARERGLDVREGDGHALPFHHEFDAVFSNAALHWMTQPEKVVEGVKRALKPGGRFVAEFGGHGNVAAIMTALRAAARSFDGDSSLATPWFYPTDREYAGMLESAGFTVRRAGLFPRPTPLPTGIEGWLQTFRGVFFDQFGDRRDAVIGYVVDLLRPSLCDKSGKWHADYVRLRVEAYLP